MPVTQPNSGLKRRASAFASSMLASSPPEGFKAGNDDRDEPVPVTHQRNWFNRPHRKAGVPQVARAVYS